MEIDLYKPCPVHEDKKIKFCCGKEIATELSHVVSKFGARQPAAALDSLNQLIERVGPKDCLVSLKVQILTSMGDYEQAVGLNEQFLQNNENHPLGLEQRAILMAGQGKIQEAYDALQNAMDLLPGNQIPVNFAGAFRAVATACLQTGAVWAARQHAQFALALKSDDEMSYELMQMVEYGTRSLLIKRNNMLSEPPEQESEWKKKYENAMKAARRGQFRKSIHLVRKALELVPDSSFLKKQLAKALGNQPDFDQIANAWKDVAACDDLPYAQRVEAAAIAQMFHAVDEASYDVVDVVYEIDGSAEETMEGLLSQKRFVNEHIEPHTSEDGTPPPKAAFLFLDRDAVDNAEGLSIEDIPVVWGQCMVFGRQTDRNPRLELVVAKRENFADVCRDFESLVGTKLNRLEEKQIGQLSKLNDELEINWHLPEKIDRATYERLEKDQQFKTAKQVLPNLKLSFLNDRTLRELASTPEGQIQAHAVLAKLTMSLDGRPWIHEWAKEARDAIGLTEIEKRDVTEEQPLDSPFEASFINLSSLDSDDLATTFMMAAKVQSISLLRSAGAELLKRSDFGGRLTEEMVYSSMAQVTGDDEECFDYLKRAKSAAKAKGHEVGRIMVTEFEQRLLRGKFNGLRALIQDIQKNHIREEGIAERMAMILSKYGLITPDGRVFLPPESESAKTGGIWTPDGESATAGVSEDASGSGESKLWIPGQ
ncbi:MAG: hypothetical protein R3C03_14370 [Pirellulaceae bacterium]